MGDQVPRQHPRYALEVSVTLKTGDRTIEARSRNLSQGGFCVHTDDPLEPGTALTATLSLVFDTDSFSEPLDLPARVVWCTPLSETEHQIGGAFLPLTHEQLAFIDLFLRYLKEARDAAGGDADDADDPDPEDPFAA